MNTFMDEIIRIATPILVLLIVSIMTYITTKLVPYLLELLSLKIGLKRYNQLKGFACDIWYLVEEYFRLHPELKTEISDKQDMFKQELLKKAPLLTDDEIYYLRQSFAGEVNQSKSNPSIINKSCISTAAQE